MREYLRGDNQKFINEGLGDWEDEKEDNPSNNTKEGNLSKRLKRYKEMRENKEKKVPVTEALIDQETFLKERRKIINKYVNIFSLAKEIDLSFIDKEEKERFLVSINELTKENRFGNGNELYSAAVDKLQKENFTLPPKHKKALMEIFAKWDEGEEERSAHLREDLHDLRRERYLQVGVKLVKKGLDFVLVNVDKDLEQIKEKVLSYFEKDNIILSSDQKHLLDEGLKAWGNNKKRMDERLASFSKRLEEQDKKIPQDITEWTNFINSKEGDEYKEELFSLIGIERDEDIEIDRENPESVNIDFSFYPFLQILVKDKNLWKQKKWLGYYNPSIQYEDEGGESLKNMAIYVLDDKEKSQADVHKTRKHELYHAMQNLLFRWAKNSLLAKKTKESKNFENDLQKIEQLIGTSGDTLEYKGVSSKQEINDFFKKVTKLKNAKDSSFNGAQYDVRDFWNGVQDEFLARFYAGEKITDWQGSLSPFVVESLLNEIKDGDKLIGKKDVEQFDKFHDTAMFYANAGVRSQDLENIISTSGSFQDAAARIKKNIHLKSYGIKKAINNMVSGFFPLRYRDIEAVLNIIEKNGKMNYFFQQLAIIEDPAGEIAKIINQDNLEQGRYYQLTVDSRLDKEEKVTKIMEKLINYYEQNNIADYLRKKCQSGKIHFAIFDAIPKKIENLKKGLELIKMRQQILEIFQEIPSTVKDFLLSGADIKYDYDDKIGRNIQYIDLNNENINKIYAGFKAKCVIIKPLKSFAFSEYADDIFLNNWFLLKSEERENIIQKTESKGEDFDYIYDQVMNFAKHTP